MFQEKPEYTDKISQSNIDYGTAIDRFKSALNLVEAMQSGFSELLNNSEILTQSISKSFGLTREFSVSIKENLANASFEAQKLGISVKDLTEAQYGIIEGLKVPMKLTNEEMVNFSASAKLLGKEGPAIAQMFSNLAPAMLKTGMQFGDIQGSMQKIVETSQDYNVSVNSVYDLVAQNLSKINTFSFRNGVDGLVQMAATSTQLGINMGDALKASEQLMNPEKAQEFINEIQRFTGKVIPGLESPLKVSYMAMNDPERLTKIISEFFASQMTVGAKGEIEAPAFMKLLMTMPGFDFLKSFNVMESGIASKRMEEVIKQIPESLKSSSILTDDVKTIIKTTAKAKEGEYFVTTKEGEKRVSELTRADIEELKKSIIPKGTDIQDRVLASQDNITKSLNTLSATLKTFGVEAARKFDINAMAKPVYDNLSLLSTTLLKTLGAEELTSRLNGIPRLITSGIGENISSSFNGIIKNFEDVLTGKKSLFEVFDLFKDKATNLLNSLPGTFAKEYEAGKKTGIEKGYYDEKYMFGIDKVNNLLKQFGLDVNGLEKFKTDIMTTTGNIDAKINKLVEKSGLAATVTPPTTNTVNTTKTTTPTNQSNELKVSGDININVKPDRNLPNFLMSALDSNQVKSEIIKIIEKHYALTGVVTGQKPKTI